MIVAVIICIALAGICDAIMDTLSHHFSVSTFKRSNPYFWNPDVSWLSKYVDRDPASGRVKWSILVLKITKPVSFTDAWHLFKRLKITLWAVAIGLVTTWYIAILVLVVRNFSFHTFYKWLLLDKGRRVNKFKDFFKKVWWYILIMYICITKKK